VNFATLWRDGIGFWRVWVLTLGKRQGLFDALKRSAANEAIRLWRDAAHDQALQGARFMKRSELELPKEFEKPRFVTLGGCVALAVARKRG
jgi:hypothetical protein